MLNPHGLEAGHAAEALLVAMRDRLVHRGPDDAGTWSDPAAGIALGFRRLSIVDLSEAGHQPMLSHDSHLVLLLNGEIYNAPAMRAEIEAQRDTCPWRGHSDTETFLEAVALWGLQAALARANGMFAIALWDRRDRSLTLARDRMGKKPLYYGWAGDTLLFGSELKALWRHPHFGATIDPGALAAYFRLGYIPAPLSIFAATRKLPAAHTIRFAPEAPHGRLVPYWSLRATAEAGLEAQQAGRPARIDELDALLQDAVALRSAADVPVGVFLSGGIDSSLVAALMVDGARRSEGTGPSAPVHSASIGFDVPNWNEAHHAAAVATHLGTIHQETRLAATDAPALLDDLAAIFDEPFADDSAIPTLLLCRAARPTFTVALSGDGGDELFVGYQRYSDAAGWLARRRRVPPTVGELARAGIDGTARPAMRSLGFYRADRKLELLSALLANGSAARFNAAIMSHTLEPGRLLAGAPNGHDNPLDAPDFQLGGASDIDQMTFMDTLTYLTDDILTKVDRASMAASMEVRCPLLDHRIVEASWRFPTATKIQGGEGKRALRSVLYRHVPPALLDRPKMGFGAPIESWLRNPALLAWAEPLMSRAALASHGLLDVDLCRALWLGITRHNRSWTPVLQSVLLFQSWHAAFTRARLPTGS